MNKHNKIIYFSLSLLLNISTMQSQSISLYQKGGEKVKLFNIPKIRNDRLIIKDKNLIKKIIPIKSIKEVRYYRKESKLVGNTFSNIGKWILNLSLIPAVVGNPATLYNFGPFGITFFISGPLINELNSKFNLRAISYNLIGLNRIDKKLIFLSIFKDMSKNKSDNFSKKSQYNIKPYGKEIGIPTVNNLISFSAKNEPIGIEAWIRKKKLRERKFLEFAIPKK